MSREGTVDLNEGTAAESEARLASVFDTAVDGIVVINDRGQVLAFNKACEKLFGYEAIDLLGRNVNRIMPDDYAREHDRYVKNYVVTGEKKIIGIGREVQGRHKDGTVFPIELSVGEASTPAGRQFIGILRDLRQRKQIEERLAKTQAQLLHMTRMSAMDEMGAAIAHELNQPLTAVLLYLQTVSRKAKVDGSIDVNILNVIDKAVREAERAGDIIQRMRQLVEKKAPARETIVVADLVRNCLEMAELGISEGPSFLRGDIADELPLLEADPVQIRQVLINLLRNAREAVADLNDRQVTLSVRQNSHLLEFRVTDNGPGVPPELVDSLFKAFSGKKQKGVGLGLAISRSIAQNHGGDLKHEPNPNGQGASFLLTLPVDLLEEHKAQTQHTDVTDDPGEE